MQVREAAVGGLPMPDPPLEALPRCAPGRVGWGLRLRSLAVLAVPGQASCAVVGAELMRPVSTLGAGRRSLTLPAALRCALTSLGTGGRT